MLFEVNKLNMLQILLAIGISSKVSILSFGLSIFRNLISFLVWLFLGDCKVLKSLSIVGIESRTSVWISTLWWVLTDTFRLNFGTDSTVHRSVLFLCSRESDWFTWSIFNFSILMLFLFISCAFSSLILAAILLVYGFSALNSLNDYNTCYSIVELLRLLHHLTQNSSYDFSTWVSTKLIY